MADEATSETSASQKEAKGHYRFRYTLLTAGIFLPLLWAFVALRNVYPVAAWNVMTSARPLQRPHTYFVLRGETVAGEVVDVRPIELTDALSGRNWGLVGATVSNGPFRLRSPHPANVLQMASVEHVNQLPQAARLPELLRAWGNLYNSRLAASSPLRLKAVRLDAYRWMGQSYSNYDQFIESWRQEL